MYAREFVVLLSYLTWHCCVNGQIYNNNNVNTLFSIAWKVYSQTTFIRTNGRLSSIDDIFGKVPLNRHDFDVHMSLRDGENVIDRDLSYRFSAKSPSDNYIELALTIPDNARNIKNREIATRVIKGENAPLIIIEGPMKMGKTTTLIELHRLINNKMPALWTVAVDVQDLFGDQPVDEITGKILIDKSIVEEFIPLFNSLIRTNPKRIVMLIDHIDYLPPSRRSRVITLISNFVNQGITAIVTGRAIQYREMESMHGLTERYLLPHRLNIPKIESYLFVKWMKNRKFPIVEQQKRVKEYIVALTQVYSTTYLPRTFLALDMIAEEFYRKCAQLLTGSDVEVAVGFYDYVIDKAPLPADLITVLQSVPINSYDFYTRYLNKFSPRGVDENVVHFTVSEMFGHYSNLATQIIEYQLNERSNLNIVTTNIVIEFCESLEIVHYYPESPFQLIFENDELLYYFAARDIIEGSTVVLSRKIFQRNTFHYYRVFVDFLNSKAENLNENNLKFIIDADDHSQISIMDGILECGFSKLFKLVSRELPYYMRESNLDRETTMTLYRKTNGMLQLERTNDEFSLMTSTIEYHFTRMELLVAQNMFELFSWTSSQFRIRKNVNRLLSIILTQPIFNDELFTVVLSMVHPDAFKRIDARSLLIHTISVKGDKCFEAANALLGEFPKILVQGNVEYQQDLMHAVARWNKPSLFEYIRKLGVPLVDIHPSIISTALNSNPVLTDPPLGWWKNMEYLIENVSDLRRISSNEIPIATYYRTSLEKVLVSAIYCLHLNPAKLNFESIDRIATFTHIRPVGLWHVFTKKSNYEYRNFLNEHRLTLEDRQISRTVFLAQCGNGLSRQEDRFDYRKTIAASLEREQVALTTTENAEIFLMLLTNIDTEEDLVDSRNIIRRLNVRDRLEMLAMVDKYEKHIARESKLLPLSSAEADFRDSLCQKITQLREEVESGSLWRVAERFSTLKKPNIPEETPNLLETVESNHAAKEDDDIDVISCARSRQQRGISRIKCLFGWQDIERFSDTIETHDIDKIRVRSDAFLEILSTEEYGNPVKARQLLKFVKELENRFGGAELIRGQLKMLLNDVLQHESLTNYRQSQRITDIADGLLEQRTGSQQIRMYSKTMALHAAAAIPFIRGIYGTIKSCQETSNSISTHCLVGSAALTTSGLAIAVPLASQYLPLAINGLSNAAHDMLPFMKGNIKIASNIASRWTTPVKLQRAANALILLSLGFDLFNIYDLSTMINLCSRQPDKCLNKDKVNQIISLTFTCISIPITIGVMMSGSLIAGPLVGFVMAALEMLAIGINEVIYYAKKYDTTFGESIDIFFRSAVWMPPSASVQDLVRRTDWVEQLHKNCVNFLDDNENIVAYATGIGKFHGDTVSAGTGSINMALENPRYNEKLSRVLPKESDLFTAVCLPEVDKTKSWENSPRSVLSAVYKCRNAFVIAHKQRWNSPPNDRQIILYNLEFIDSGTVVGSKVRHNLFLIGSGDPDFNIIGGTGNVTNKFILLNDSFRGNIIINGKPPINIVDLTNVNSSYLSVIWNTSMMMGRVQCGIKDPFFIIVERDTTSNLHFIGRNNKSEYIKCNYHHQHNRHFFENQQLITIDSGGGESLTNMDHIEDCRMSVVRPYTRIVGSNSSNTIHTSQVWLHYATSISTKIIHATIDPQQSTFVVIFVNHPVFNSLVNITYNLETASLTWILRNTDESTLSLSIVPYHTGNAFISSNKIIDKTQIDPVNCMFIDSYHGATIALVMKKPAHGITTMNIQHYNVFATVNTSRLVDVSEQYMNMGAIRSANLHVVTKITHSMTNRSFTFGSMENEQFLIDRDTVFLFGNGGSDSYALTRESSNYTWINNEANDDALDTLIVPATTCDTLRAQSGSRTFDIQRGSTHDVTLFCLINNGTVELTSIHVILMNYLMDPNQRHLQIYWQDALYILLPPHWIDEEARYESSRNVELALLISFDDNRQTGKTVTLTSRDTRVVLNISDANAYPLVAYRSGVDDLVLTRTSFDDKSPLLVVLLQGFFWNNTDSVVIDWFETVIFIVDNMILTNDDIRPRILTVDDIRKLYLDNWSVTGEGKSNLDLFDEYHVNFTSSINRTVIIHHNSISHSDYKLGVLIVTGALPKEFHANWIDNNGMSLVICARATCVIIKNWCSPKHKLHRMEFIYSLARRPIVIADINLIQCESSDSENNTFNEVSELNRKFKHAQLLLLHSTDDDDNSRLIRCIGSLITEIVADHSMFELFGFASLVQYRQFMNNYCKILFTSDNLINLSLEKIRKNLSEMIEIYLDGEEVAVNYKKDAELVKNALSKLDNFCWQSFTNSLIVFNNISHLDETSNIISICLN